MGSHGRLGAALHDDGARLCKESIESFSQIVSKRNALSKVHARLLVSVVEDSTCRIRAGIQFGTQEQVCLRTVSNKRRTFVFKSVSFIENGRSEDLPLGVDHNPVDVGGQQSHLRQERRYLQCRQDGQRFLHSGRYKFISVTTNKIPQVLFEREEVAASNST